MGDGGGAEDAATRSDGRGAEVDAALSGLRVRRARAALARHGLGDVLEAVGVEVVALPRVREREDGVRVRVVVVELDAFALQTLLLLLRLHALDLHLLLALALVFMRDQLGTFKGDSNISLNKILE